MRAEQHSDKKFITLLRQSCTLPFAPLPCTALREGKRLDRAGNMFAVFQPIDKINTRILADLEQTHRDRKAWQDSTRASKFQKGGGQRDAGGQKGAAQGLKRPHPDQDGSGGENRSQNGPAEPEARSALLHDAMAQLPDAQVCPLSSCCPVGELCGWLRVTKLCCYLQRPLFTGAPPHCSVLCSPVPFCFVLFCSFFTSVHSSVLFIFSTPRPNE
jgi:hypothetical protein